jgi:hypothetical protein
LHEVDAHDHPPDGGLVDLEPLALALGWVVGGAEDRGDVVPGRFVGMADPHLPGRDR